MSKDTGILYQPSMVQALLAGTKRQTRHIVHKIDGFNLVTDLRESSPGVWQFQDSQPDVRTMIATDACSESANRAADGDKTYRSGFRQIWTRINDAQSWDINPAVWVIELEVEPFKDGK